MLHHPPVIKELLAIVGLSAALGLSYNFFSVKGIPLVREEPVKISLSDSAALIGKSPSGGVSPAETEHAFIVISLDQMQRLVAEHRGLRIDAREPDEFRKGRVPGAVNIPALEAENYFEQLAVMPRDTLVVVYCTNPECHLGRSLIEFMRVMEFKNLVLYDEGWDGWKKAGMPVESTAVSK